jgi:hypothetical protein
MGAAQTKQNSRMMGCVISLLVLLLLLNNPSHTLPA